VAKATALAGPLTWCDERGGIVAARPEVLGDVVLARKDAPVSYHLAVTVDDATQGVTDVIRGQDLFLSTHVHRLLQALLGLPTPGYCHHRLLIGPDGERLAKRHGAVSLRDLRERGVPARRVVGWLAAGAGLAEAGEEVTPAELVGRFDLGRIPRDPQILPPLPWS
jgi:glutamyl-Q tRNA(Asp) synthetase